MSGPSGALREILERIEQGAAGSPHAADAAAIRARLDGPLRVAIAGRVKAGKSTLLNALVGERIAPTDAGECTRLVTWYERADQYGVRAELAAGGAVTLPFRRAGSSLEVDLGALTVEQVTSLHVGWPTSVLADVTFIDTPGLASLNDENSARTREFLEVHDGDGTDADAVIFLMRHVHRVDLGFLDAFMDRTVTGSSPVNSVAVLSRADEIGGGRPDAMVSAARIAARYATDPEVRTRCATVVPLAGLLAESALTFREDEAAAIRMLAGADGELVDDMLLSIDQFCDLGASDLTVEVRRALLDRLGLFGVRIAVDAARHRGVTSAAGLAQLLLDASGLPELRRLLAEQFTPRATVLKARTCLTRVRALADRLAADHPELAARVRADLERLEVTSVDFARIRAAHLVGSGLVDVPDEDREHLHRVLTAVEPATTLAVAGDATADERKQAVLQDIGRFRAVAGDPLQPPLIVEVYEAAARTCESVYVTL